MWLKIQTVQRRDNNQNCPVLCCVRHLCRMVCIQMRAVLKFCVVRGRCISAVKSRGKMSENQRMSQCMESGHPVCLPCVLCSSAASDEAAGRNVTSDFQAAASGGPADGTAVIHQVECSEYCRRDAHPAHHHISAGHSTSVVGRLSSQRAEHSDCWCHDDTRHCRSATSHFH